MNILVFDIETVPDTATGARIYGLDDLHEADIARAMVTRQMQKTNGSDFLPLHLHRVVAISAVYHSGNTLKVWSLGDVEADEKELVTRFYNGIDQFSPTLVSWNGAGFDLPVLHYRGLLHGVEASRYWDHGDHDREFRFNNYLSRYHWRHIDLMDVLSGFNLRAAAPLDQVAQMLGFPGKLGMSGEKVWESFLQGDIEAIRHYCEADVLNTYLVFLKYQKVRGQISEEGLRAEYETVRSFLERSGKPHFQEFQAAWQDQANSDD